jgi:hypothetical protein
MRAIEAGVEFVGANYLKRRNSTNYLIQRAFENADKPATGWARDLMNLMPGAQALGSEAGKVYDWTPDGGLMPAEEAPNE